MLHLQHQSAHKGFIQLPTDEFSFQRTTPSGLQGPLPHPNPSYCAKLAASVLSLNRWTTIKTIPPGVSMLVTQRSERPSQKDRGSKETQIAPYSFVCSLVSSLAGRQDPLQRWDQPERLGLVPSLGTMELPLNKHTLAQTHKAGGGVGGEGGQSLSFTQIFCLLVMSGMLGYWLCWLT